LDLPGVKLLVSLGADYCSLLHEKEKYDNIKEKEDTERIEVLMPKLSKIVSKEPEDLVLPKLESKHSFS